MKESAKIDRFGRPKHYVFEPRRLHAIARAASRLKDRDQMFHYITEEVAKAYPGHIETTHHWVWNNAGGAMGQMTLLHASLREYLILFGSSLGTEGHSGRYSAEVFDFMFDGDMYVEYQGQINRHEYKPGDAALLPQGSTKHYCIPDHGWMLEYGRGHNTILSMLPFGLADSLLSTLDYRTFFRTLYHYGRLVVRELFQKGKDWDLILKLIGKIAVLIVIGVVLSLLL